VTTSLLRYQTYQIEQACRTSAGDPSGSTGALLLPDNSKPRSRIGETLAVSSPAEFRVAAKTWKFTGSRKRRRRKVNGVYARVYVLDQQGEYRTVASIEHLVGLAQFLPQARARVVDGGVFRTPRFCGRKVVARARAARPARCCRR